MDNISRKIVRIPKEEYDKEPVLYCAQCLSLRIKSIPGLEDTDYCDDCNCTYIKQSSIQDWENLYVKRYGYKFLDKIKY